MRAGRRGTITGPSRTGCGPRGPTFIIELLEQATRRVASSRRVPAPPWSAPNEFRYEDPMSLGGAFRVLLSELASVGLDPRVVCAGAGVDPQAVEDDRVPLALDVLTRVLEHAEAAAADPLLGLHMAEHAKGRGLLSYLTRAQPTVGDGLRA